MFIVNDQKIEFHSHEVVKIAQQMVVEAEDNGKFQYSCRLKQNRFVLLNA